MENTEGFSSQIGPQAVGRSCQQLVPVDFMDTLHQHQLSIEAGNSPAKLKLRILGYVTATECYRMFTLGFYQVSMG
jgi:hypothetical protein